MTDPTIMDRPRLTRSLFGVALIPFLVIFASALFTDRPFGFRDVAHYYGPYWRYVHAEWSSVGLPGWNPLEENGRPLAADATASVFYPGQLILWLPIPFGVALKLYIFAHITLAILTTFLAARSLGRSAVSSWFAAIAFAFGGSVVFQYCNPIFLVGAAWLPLGFATIQWTAVSGQLKFAVALAAAMAMTVLGGNPQTAYLLVLVAALRIACNSRERVDAPELAADGRAPPSAWRTSRLQLLALFAAATFLALLLSAVQVFPSLEWARGSERAFYDAPRSLAEVASDLTRGERASFEGLCRAPALGTHRDSQYEFSIGPWRWAEMFWPNFGGRPFPVNQRWLSIIPAEGRFWSPTLYMGLVPVLLGLSSLRLRAADRTQRWLSWCALLFGLACLGEYGLAWLVNEVRLWFGMPPTEFWSPVGGIYWLMNACLPGFVMFRYPAKLWTFVALALSLLGAGKLDEIQTSPISRERTGLAVYVAITITLLIGIVCFKAWFSGWFMAVQPDKAFGPLDRNGAIRGLQGSFVQGLAVAILMRVCLRESKWIRRPAIWIVLLTAFDLGLAHAWLAPTVPAPGALPLDPFSMAIDSRNEDQPSTVRTYRWTVSGWYPKRWSLESDPQRLADVVSWERMTLRPKYNLDRGFGAMNSSTSFSSIHHQAAVDLLHWTASQDRSKFYRLLNVMGIEYVVAPPEANLAGQLARLDVPASGLVNDSAGLWSNPDAFPRAWVVHRARNRPLPRRFLDLRSDLDAVLLSDDPSQAVDRCVVLEPSVKIPTYATQAGDSPVGADEFCEVQSDRKARLVIRTHLNEPGFVVVRDAYAPGWTCTVQRQRSSPEDVPVLRANRIMRAIALPSGTHTLTMDYQPRSVYWGAGISAIAWLSVMVGWLITTRTSLSADA